MRLIFTCLVLFISVFCYGSLNIKKTCEAMIRAQSGQYKKVFSYQKYKGPIPEKELAELIRSHPGKNHGPYHLNLAWLPPHTRFKLYQFNLLGIVNPKLHGNGVIDENGEAWLLFKKIKTKLSDKIEMVGEVLPGEPIYAMIVLDDKKTYISTNIVPEPLETFGQDGRHVMMEIISCDYVAYFVKGENFIPKEEIVISFHSHEGIFLENIQADDLGEFQFVLHGKPSEDNLLDSESIHISSKVQIDPMIISYDWTFLKFGYGQDWVKKVCNLFSKPRNRT